MTEGAALEKSLAGLSFSVAGLGRVGASLCRAVGLEELIAPTLEDYESLALELSRDPSRLAVIKARLGSGGRHHPLFDADLHRRGVELAFEAMWTRHRNGQPPASFAVGVS